MPAVPISNIVNVSISLASGAVQQQGFGTPMLLGKSTVLGASQILTVTSAADWITEGGATSDEEYKALNALFSQQPAPSSAKVARRGSEVSAVQRIVFAADFQSGGTVSIIFTYTDLAGSTITETVSEAFDTSHAQTISNVVAALGAFSVVSVANGTDDSPGATFNITIDASITREGSVTFTTAAVTGTGAQTATTSVPTAPVTLSNRLATLITETVDWYWLLLTHAGTDAERNMDTYRAAVWVEGNNIDCFHVAQNDQAALPAGTAGNIAKVLEAAGYNRTHIIYHPESEYADAALVGRVGSTNLDVASVDFWLQRLGGITVQDYTVSQRNTLDGDSIGYVTTINGIGRYFGGKAASARYIDQQLTLDWFAARVAEEGLSYLARGADSNIKRTYTDRTASDLAGLVRKVWQTGVRAAHFAETKTDANGETVPGLTIVQGAVADQSSANKAARLYAGLSASVQLAGAIRTVNPLTIVLEV